jgi:DNA-binding transcriptional regulator YhcF (GntR family)
MSTLLAAPTKTRQVVERIEKEIGAGILRPGARMLPRRALCSQFGVSSAVVNAAYRDLERKGLIARSARSGVVVAPGVKPASTLLLGVVTSYDRADIEGYFEPLLAAARQRRMTPMVISIHRDDWRQTLGDMANRRPDVVAVDVDATYFPWEDLEAALAPAPVCYVNRWEWRPGRPEVSVR